MLGFAGAAVAAGMTVVWLVVVPEKADQTDGLQEIAIRWGHPLCWALLTVAGVLFAVGGSKRARDIVCYAAAACYAAFLAGVLL